MEVEKSCWDRLVLSRFSPFSGLDKCVHDRVTFKFENLPRTGQFAARAHALPPAMAGEAPQGAAGREKGGVPGKPVEPPRANPAPTNPYQTKDEFHKGILIGDNKNALRYLKTDKRKRICIGCSEMGRSHTICGCQTLPSDFRPQKI